MPRSSFFARSATLCIIFLLFNALASSASFAQPNVMDTTNKQCNILESLSRKQTPSRVDIRQANKQIIALLALRKNIRNAPSEFRKKARLYRVCTWMHGWLLLGKVINSKPQNTTFRFARVLSLQRSSPSLLQLLIKLYHHITLSLPKTNHHAALPSILLAKDQAGNTVFAKNSIHFSSFRPRHIHSTKGLIGKPTDKYQIAFDQGIPGLSPPPPLISLWGVVNQQLDMLPRKQLLQWLTELQRLVHKKSSLFFGVKQVQRNLHRQIHFTIGHLRFRKKIQHVGCLNVLIKNIKACHTNENPKFCIEKQNKTLSPICPMQARINWNALVRRTSFANNGQKEYSWHDRIWIRYLLLQSYQLKGLSGVFGSQHNFQQFWKKLFPNRSFLAPLKMARDAKASTSIERFRLHKVPPKKHFSVFLSLITYQTYLYFRSRFTRDPLHLSLLKVQQLPSQETMKTALAKQIKKEKLNLESILQPFQAFIHRIKNPQKGSSTRFRAKNRTFIGWSTLPERRAFFRSLERISESIWRNIRLFRRVSMSLQNSKKNKNARASLHLLLQVIAEYTGFQGLKNTSFPQYSFGKYMSFANEARRSFIDAQQFKLQRLSLVQKINETKATRRKTLAKLQQAKLLIDVQTLLQKQSTRWIKVRKLQQEISQLASKIAVIGHLKNVDKQKAKTTALLLAKKIHMKAMAQLEAMKQIIAGSEKLIDNAVTHLDQQVPKLKKMAKQMQRSLDAAKKKKKGFLRKISGILSVISTALAPFTGGTSAFIGAATSIVGTAEKVVNFAIKVEGLVTLTRQVLKGKFSWRKIGKIAKIFKEGKAVFKEGFSLLPKKAQKKLNTFGNDMAQKVKFLTPYITKVENLRSQISNFGKKVKETFRKKKAEFKASLQQEQKQLLAHFRKQFAKQKNAFTTKLLPLLASNLPLQVDKKTGKIKFDIDAVFMVMDELPNHAKNSISAIIKNGGIIQLAKSNLKKSLSLKSMLKKAISSLPPTFQDEIAKLKRNQGIQQAIQKLKKKIKGKVGKERQKLIQKLKNEKARYNQKVKQYQKKIQTIKKKMNTSLEKAKRKLLNSLDTKRWKKKAKEKLKQALLRRASFFITKGKKLIAAHNRIDKELQKTKKQLKSYIKLFFAKETKEIVAKVNKVRQQMEQDVITAQAQKSPKMLLHVAKKVTEQTKGLKNELRKLKVRLHEIRFSEEEKRTTMRIASHEERAAKKSVRASILMKKVAQLQIGKNQNLLRIAISKKQTEQLLLAYRKGYQNIVRMNLEASENKLLYLEEKQRYLQAFASKKILRPGLEGLAYFDRDPRTPQKLVERINNMSRGIFGMLRWVIVMLAPRNERATAFRVYKTLIMSLRKLQLNRAYLQKELTKRNPFTTQCHPRSVINHCQKLTSTNQKQKLFGLLQSLRCCFIQRKSSFKPNLHIYFGINRRVPLCSWKDWRLTKRNKRWYLQGRFKYRLHFGDSKQQDKPGFLSVEDLADNGRSHYYVMPGYTYLLAEGSGHIGKMSFFLLPPKSPYSRMGHKNKVWHTIRRKELRKVQESLAGAIILKTAFDELFSGGSERISIYPAGGMWVLGISVRIKHGMLQKLMKKTNGKTAKAIQIMKKKFLSCGQGAKFRFKLGVFRSPLR